jgi:hypothetical protein
MIRARTRLDGAQAAIERGTVTEAEFDNNFGVHSGSPPRPI